jgi:hypothetical protein
MTVQIRDWHLPYLATLVFVIPAISTIAVAISVTLHPKRVDLAANRSQIPLR